MTHRAQGIFNAVVTAVTDLTTTEGRVYTNRTYAIPKSDVNALSVRLGADQLIGGEYSNNSFVDRELIIYVRIHIKDEEADLDNQLLTIEEEVWIALMADITLGLSHVTQIIPAGRQEPELENNEKPTIACDTTWLVHYRHSITDPGA